MQPLLLILHILLAISIVALVLLQHGRGADMGASFGSGASNTILGSSGAVPFLMKVTAVCATLFFLTSISLTYLASSSVEKANVLNMPTIPAASVKHANTDAKEAFSFTPPATKDGAKK